MTCGVFGWVRAFQVRIYTLLFLCIGIGLIYGLLGFASAKNRHLDSTACQTCHLAGNAVTAGNAHQLIDTQERLCKGCHIDALAVSHPSGFQAGRLLPAEYPVDWKGDLTCSSCHLVHGDNPGLMRGDKRGKELCLSCHEIEFFYQMADGGVSVLNGVHLAQPPKNSFIEILDSRSQHCMSCHYENVREVSGVILAHSQTTMPHPVGVQYNASGKEKYHALDTLSEKITLPDGKLSCVSCHQAYNEKHGELVMSNKGSALCFQCHNI